MAIPLLPNGCGIYASCAANQLHCAGFPVLLLSITCRERRNEDYDGHLVVFWRVDQIVRAYDAAGTSTLPKGFKLTDDPLKIARAWAKKANYDHVLSAKEW